MVRAATHTRARTGARPADGNGPVFKWRGRAGHAKVEFARDLEFTQIVSNAEVSGSEWVLAMPASGGRHCLRYRSVEPDGFVSRLSRIGLQLPLPLLL